MFTALLLNRMRAEQALARGQQPIDDRGAAVALLFQPRHARRARTRSARFRFRRRTPTAAGRRHDAESDPVFVRHRSASFSARNARTSAGSTSGAMKALADAAHQDEGELAALDLLVLRDQLHQPVGVRLLAGNCGDPDRQPDRGQMRTTALGVGLPAAGRAAPRTSNASAMPIATASPCSSRVGKAGGRLERMAEGVAEIEQRALAGLALVARDDRRPWCGSSPRWRARAPARRRTRPASSPRARRRTRRRRSGRISRPRHSRRGTARAGSVSSSAVSASTRTG